MDDSLFCLGWGIICFFGIMIWGSIWLINKLSNGGRSASNTYTVSPSTYNNHSNYENGEDSSDTSYDDDDDDSDEDDDDDDDSSSKGRGFFDNFWDDILDPGSKYKNDDEEDDKEW